jgi:hypothetical protein
MTLAKKIIVSVIVVVAIIAVWFVMFGSAKPEVTFQNQDSAKGVVAETELVPRENNAKPAEIPKEKLATYSNPEYGISFEYPAKYSNVLSDIYLPALQYRDYQKPTATLADTIDVRWIPFKSGDSPEQALMNDVVFDGSGAHPKSFDSFSLIHLGDNDFYKIRTGLFEGVLGYRYYLVKENGAFVFVVTSLGVPWTDPKFNPETDARHLELLEMLKTVKLMI